MWIKYKKYNYIFILFFIFIVFADNIFALDEKEYVIECQKCIKGQKELSDALEKYQMDNKKIGMIRIVSEEDYQSIIKQLFEKKYLTYRILGTEKECSYRYNSEDSEIFCIKHGSIKFLTYYVEGSEECEQYYLKNEKFILSFILTGIGFIISIILL